MNTGNSNREQDGPQGKLNTDEIDPSNIKQVQPEAVTKDNIEPDNSQQQSYLNEYTGVVQGVGHQLRAGRIACNMSVEDVSRQLRLSIRQIEAIENEDFEKLPGRTFLRGFIRNYANLVHLDIASVLLLLPPSTSSNTILGEPQAKNLKTCKWNDNNNIRLRRKRPILQTYFIAISLLLIVIYTAYRIGNWGQVVNEVEIGIMSEIGLNTESEVVELKLPLPPATLLDHQGQQVTALGTSPTSLVVPSSIDTVLGVLHFKFNSESWVEIKDGSNKTIFKQINPSGTEQIISGQRPLTIVIGDANNVNLSYNNRLFDLNPYINKNDGIARLTLE